MAWSCGRSVLLVCRRSFSRNIPNCIKVGEFADPLDHATGLEKRELLAELAGNDDPYSMKAIKRASVSTKDSPNLVPSAFNSRIIGCVCEEDATSVNWMWLHEGAPRRCECGHWFKLIEKAPL